MARRPTSEHHWQGFSDLAMGLMAVFVLIMVVLLWHQGKLNAQVEAEKAEKERILEEVVREKATLERLRMSLERERSDFAAELMALFEETYELVLAQDNAEDWLSSVFEQGSCRLRMSERGELVIVDERGHASAANLYEPAQFALSADGRVALDTCRANFLQLAYCLAPTEGAPPEAIARRAQYCLESVDDDAQTLPVLRSGVEALVLEGSTDRIPIGGGTPSIRTQGAPVSFASDVGASFVENAYLGAERARQALGNLVSLVETANADEWDALEVLLSRVRVESPSFGRYQAGPMMWREPGCDPARPGCDAARSLSLRVRWQKRALRRPFELVRERICTMLAKRDSALAIGLSSRGRDIDDERGLFGCPEVMP